MAVATEKLMDTVYCPSSDSDESSHDHDGERCVQTTCTDSEHPQHGHDDDTELETEPLVTFSHTHNQSLNTCCTYDCHVQNSPHTAIMSPMITESSNTLGSTSVGCTQSQDNQLMTVHFSRTEEEPSNFHDEIEQAARNQVHTHTITLTLTKSGSGSHAGGNNLNRGTRSIKKPKRATSGGQVYRVNKWPNTKITNGGKIGRVSRIGFSKSGVWAAADYNSHSVHVCDANDNLIKTIGIKGQGNSQFKHPVGVAFDNKNCLYVSEYGNHRVQKFDANFEYMLQFGNEGDDDGQLNHPMGIAVYKDKVYIADSANSHIAVFYTNGKFCCNIVDGCLRDPYDVAISKTNGRTNGKTTKRLLITDYSACCIQTFMLNGHTLTGLVALELEEVS